MKKSVLSILFLFSVNFLFGMLDTPLLLSPQNGITNLEPIVLLDWSAVSGASAYQCRIGKSSLLNNEVRIESNASQLNTSQLSFGTVWYWQVRAVKTSLPADSSEWSTIRSFSTLDQLILVSPPNNSSGNEPSVLLDWAGINGVVAYDYQWDTSAAFNSPLSYDNSVSNSSQANAFSLRFGTKYFWRVRARHNSDTTRWSDLRSFSTLDQLILVSPPNNSSGNEPSVLLDWAGINGVAAYDYQWDTSAAFNSPLSYDNSVSNSSQANAFSLRFGTRYFWRVRARHNSDTTRWSDLRSFSTLDQLILVSPSNGASNTSLNLLIDWSGINGVSAYQYRYSPNPDFTNSVLQTISTSSQANLVNLLYGTTYYWTVRACHNADTSNWSPARNFTTLFQMAGFPNLISPANVSIQIPFSGTSLQWTSVATATFYEYQLDEDQAFGSPVSASTAGTDATTGELQPGTIYYWKVRAGNGSGFSAWSQVWRFTTEIATNTTDAGERTRFRIIPNPSSGYIELSAGELPIKENETVGIYSFDGKRVHEIRIGQSNTQYDLQQLPKGIYLVRIGTGVNMKSFRLVLQ
jgi:hypothetical protein